MDSKKKSSSSGSKGLFILIADILIAAIFFPDNFWLVVILLIVFELFYYSYKSSKKQVKKEEIDKNSEKKQTTQIEQNITLIGRNEDVINARLNKLYAGDKYHYIDNEVISCVEEIAKKENKPNLVPKFHEYLYQWETRANMPKEWLDLKDFIKNKFQARHSELLQKKEEEQKKKEAEKKKKLETSGHALIERNHVLIDKFLEIAERKVSIIDDYGDENWEILPNEILICLKKIAEQEGFFFDTKRYLKDNYYRNFSLPEEYRWLHAKLIEMFNEYHQKKKKISTQNIDLENISGVEFETHIAKILKENGFDDVRGTPATGDQGADLIVKKNGRTIIIQAKRYQSAVGNKAVQEVVSAVQFYDGNEGWVITNSTFTPSAKALAQKSNIRLIDGKMLEDIKEYIN